jgi:hypothetical protein
MDDATIEAGDGATGTRQGIARFGPFSSELRSFLELMAICGLAFAQPAFDILQKNAELFVTRETSVWQLLALSALVVLGVPLVLWCVEVLFGLVVLPARRYVHALLIGLVCVVLAVETVKRSTQFGPVALELIAAGLALLAAYLVLRFAVVRLYLRFLAIAPIVFALIFVFASPVSDVVLRGQQASAASTTITHPHRVVEIVLDEFPLESLLNGHGRIDAQLFPHFAELANESTWYRNDSTVAPWTLQAVPAIMTGDYPRDPDMQATASNYPHSIFTLLGGQYSENVHESVTHLCPTSVCTSTTANSPDSGLTGLISDTTKLWREFASPNRVPDRPQLVVGESESDPNVWGTGAKFVRSLKRTTDNHLDFLHILLPHEPWHLIQTGQDNNRLKVASGLVLFYSWETQQVAEVNRERHLLQVQAADAVVGNVIAKLKKLGQWKNSVVVVTADHGIAFTGGEPSRGIDHSTQDQIVWTPLFIKAPGQTKGRVDDRPAHSIDILPTIADLIGTKLPWKVDGKSLVGPPQPEAPRRVFDWELNVEHATPPSKFLSVDGPTNFAKVLRAAASTAPAHESDRLYRVGPYGALIGEHAAPLVDRAARGPEGSIEAPGNFEKVDPKSSSIPWTYLNGTVDAPGGKEPLAIAVNGVVAGLTFTFEAEPGAPHTTFWSPLLPSAFHKGHNAVQVYRIEGSPQAPRLVAVRGAGV